MKAACELGPNWGYWSGDIWEDMQKGIFNRQADCWWGKKGAQKMKLIPMIITEMNDWFYPVEEQLLSFIGACAGERITAAWIKQHVLNVL